MAETLPFDSEAVKALKPGGTLQSEGLFQGVTNEPCLWRLTKRSPTRGEYTFTVTYFGVFVAKMVVLIRDDKVSVEEL